MLIRINTTSFAIHSQTITDAHDHEEIPFQALRLTCQLVPRHLHQTCPADTAREVQAFWFHVPREAREWFSNGHFHYCSFLFNLEGLLEPVFLL